MYFNHKVLIITCFKINASFIISYVPQHLLIKSTKYSIKSHENSDLFSVFNIRYGMLVNCY